MSTAEPVAPPDLSQSPEDLQDASAILIKIMSPSPGVPPDLSFRVSPESTIGQLKQSIRASLDAKPANENQRLIYRGKLLEDRLTITLALAGNDQPQNSYTIHLVIRPPPTSSASSTDPLANRPAIPAPAPGSGNAATTGFRPPGFRHGNGLAAHRGQPVTTSTTSTYQPNPGTTITTRTVTSSFTINRPAGQFVAPPPPPPPRIPVAGANRFTGMSLDQIQNELRNMRPEMLRRPPGALPNGAFNIPGAGHPAPPGMSGMRVNSISAPALQYHPGSHPVPTMSTSAQGSSSALASAASTSRTTTPEQMISQNINDIRAMQRGELPAQDREDENSARRRALQASLEEMQQDDAIAPPGFTFSTSFQQVPSNLAIHAVPAVPQIPQITSTIDSTSLVYLLHDPQGRPSALLVGPPGSAVGNSTAGYGVGSMQPNLHAGAGAGMNALPPDFVRHLDDAIRVGQQAAGGQQPMAGNAGGAGLRGGRPIQLDQLRLVDILRGLINRRGDIWLALKLVGLVVLLAGNGGWRRVLYFSSIALLIFVWQTGMFNMLFAQGFLEGFNGPPADEPNNPAQPAAAPQAEAGAEMDPARTAQLMLERRGGRAREAMRSVERGVAIFLASLVPGLHERHVRQVEQNQAAHNAQQAGEGENANNENNDQVPVAGANDIQGEQRGEQGGEQGGAQGQHEANPEPGPAHGVELVGGEF